VVLSVKQIKTFRRWLAVILFASLLVLLITFVGPVFDQTRGAESESELRDLLIGLGSLFTSLISAGGVVVTTVIAGRKERREAGQARVDLEKSKLEFEKLRQEIADKNSAAQEKRNKMNKRRRRVR
jgi:type VI protein secretion system component VasK